MIAGVALLLAVVGVMGLPGCEQGPVPPAYNLLLITLDTTRADRLGLYGYPKPTSANLDALATEATVFDLAIAQAAVTPVSHASILTGLDPHHHGLRVMHGLVANRLPAAQTTLAEVWQAAGGQTAAFVSAFPVSAAFGLDQGFAHFDADFPATTGVELVSPTGMINTHESQRRADATTDAVVAWLRADENQQAPFCLWVHYFDPHDAIVAPPRELTEELCNGRFRPPSGERPDLLRALYDAELFYMDRELGRLLSTLKVRGQWGRTIVVVVADHGEGLGDHDWWTHGILYQEQIRVPCLIRTPDDPGGRRVASLVRTTDLLPTMLELAGIDRRLWPSMDGRSLVGAMRTGRTEDSRVAYSESVNILRYLQQHDAIPTDHKDDKLYTLLDGQRKLIYHQLRPAESEFYDLASDPGELQNLAVPSRPAAMDSMLRRLDSMRVYSPIMPGMSETDLDRARQLERLGYIQ